jgi:hypothetical protein
MWITSKNLTAKLNLIDTLIVWPDDSTLFMASCVNDLSAEWGSFWIEAAIDCLHSVSDGMISVQCRHKEFNLNIQKLRQPKQLFPLYEFPFLGTPDTTMGYPVSETLPCVNNNDPTLSLQ